MHRKPTVATVLVGLIIFAVLYIVGQVVYAEMTGRLDPTHEEQPYP